MQYLCRNLFERLFYPCLICGLLLAWLSACTPLRQTIVPAATSPAATAGPALARLTLPPTWTPALTGSPAAFATAPATRTPLPVYQTPTSSPTYTPAPRPPVVFDPQEFFTAADPLHGVILFTSTYGNPFPGFFARWPGLTTSRYSQPQLWAISTDGQRGGRLTGPGLGRSTVGDLGQGALLFQPPAPGSTPLLLTSITLTLDTSVLQTFSLPAECTYPSGLPLELASYWIPCSKFHFSPDGRWLAMAWQADICGTGLLLLDSQSGEVLYQSLGGTHWFQFLDDQRLLVQTGHCEGGEVSVLDIASGELQVLGHAGEPRWNADHTAFFVNASTYATVNQAVWAYDVADGLFLPEPRFWEFDNRAFWTPNGDAIIYEHRQIAHDYAASTLTFSGAMSLIRVERQSGERTSLAADPAYDYHLCTGWDPNCIQLRGDWVQVLRFPFVSARLSFTGENLYDYKRVSCLLAGTECEQGAELFALNLVSGELLPWKEAPLPEAASGPLTGNAPDLLQPPLYSDPAGKYAFYPGLDGHSLWLQPSDPTLLPVLWVQSGQSFIYIP